MHSNFLSVEGWTPLILSIFCERKSWWSIEDILAINIINVGILRRLINISIVCYRKINVQVHLQIRKKCTTNLWLGKLRGVNEQLILLVVGSKEWWRYGRLMLGQTKGEIVGSLSPFPWEYLWTVCGWPEHFPRTQNLYHHGLDQLEMITGNEINI